MLRSLSAAVSVLPVRAVQHQLVPAARVGAVAADEQRPDAELAGEVRDRVALGPVNPVRTVVDAIGCIAAAADAIARLEHGDGDAALRERARRAKSGEAGANHEHAATAIAAASIRRQPAAQPLARHGRVGAPMRRRRHS